LKATPLETLAWRRHALVACGRPPSAGTTGGIEVESRCRIAECTCNGELWLELQAVPESSSSLRLAAAMCAVQVMRAEASRRVDQSAAVRKEGCRCRSGLPGWWGDAMRWKKVGQGGAT